MTRDRDIAVIRTPPSRWIRRALAWTSAQEAQNSNLNAALDAAFSKESSDWSLPLPSSS